jgi:hypothetical protein
MAVLSTPKRFVVPELSEYSWLTYVKSQPPLVQTILNNYTCVKQLDGSRDLKFDSRHRLAFARAMRLHYAQAIAALADGGRAVVATLLAQLALCAPHIADKLNAILEVRGEDSFPLVHSVTGDDYSSFTAVYTVDYPCFKIDNDMIMFYWGNGFENADGDRIHIDVAFASATA